MTLRELRYLVALADHGHFGRAAAACHVSQPTLSTQLRKLEGYLGVTLVERGSQLRLTPKGEQVVAQARRVLRETDHLLETTRQRRALDIDPLDDQIPRYLAGGLFCPVDFSPDET
ncbi:LysR family transcriptional regulator [Solimonas sp. K1W22B-7]|nr:LysR family transcriptional regulator [Solimonas sp. K1W22B-7]AXQ28000.1 LysR family transcriptional regulator [Solimonas sp. K1W22B-7]